MWPGMQRMTTKRCHQFYGGDYKYIHARCSRLSTYQIKPNKAYQPNQTKKNTPNLPGQICSTKLTKPNLQKQTYLTKLTKSNIANQTLGFWYLRAQGNVFWKDLNSCVREGTLLGLTDLILGAKNSENILCEIVFSPHHHCAVLSPCLSLDSNFTGLIFSIWNPTGISETPQCFPLEV